MGLIITNRGLMKTATLLQCGLLASNLAIATIVNFYHEN